METPKNHPGRNKTMGTCSSKPISKWIFPLGEKIWKKWMWIRPENPYTGITGITGMSKLWSTSHTAMMVGHMDTPVPWIFHSCCSWYCRFHPFIHTPPFIDDFPKVKPPFRVDSHCHPKPMWSTPSDVFGSRQRLVVTFCSVTKQRRTKRVDTRQMRPWFMGSNNGWIMGE